RARCPAFIAARTECARAGADRGTRGRRGSRSRLRFIRTAFFIRRPLCMNELVARFESMTVFGVSLSSLAPALVAALVFYLAVSLGLRYAVSRARRVAERTSNRVDDTLVEVLGATNRFFLVLAALL